MKIKRQIIDEIFSHAKKEAPLEACGYLASQNAVFVACYKLTNMDKSPEHFSFDPKEQFEALRDARAKDLGIDAVYHSHPQSPARLSQEDIKLAYDPDKFYLIVSLADGNEEIKAFKVTKGDIKQETLEVVDVD